jgi:hypothetical protein
MVFGITRLQFPQGTKPRLIQVAQWPTMSAQLKQATMRQSTANL